MTRKYGVTWTFDEEEIHGVIGYTPSGYKIWGSLESLENSLRLHHNNPEIELIPECGEELRYTVHWGYTEDGYPVYGGIGSLIVPWLSAEAHHDRNRAHENGHKYLVNQADIIGWINL